MPKLTMIPDTPKLRFDDIVTFLYEVVPKLNTGEYRNTTRHTMYRIGNINIDQGHYDGSSTPTPKFELATPTEKFPVYRQGKSNTSSTAPLGGYAGLNGIYSTTLTLGRQNSYKVGDNSYISAIANSSNLLSKYRVK